MKNLKENVEIILSEDSLDKKLQKSSETGKPLNIKLGLDPTSPDLHLGHAVSLKKIREFQDAGHRVIIIVGDFTAKIGDPTGKNVTRPALSDSEIKNNAKTYIAQIGKILDTKKIKLVKNSKWFKKMNLADTIKLMSSYNLGRILMRDDFSKRMKSDSAIAMHEILYPLLQGYDSLMINADIEIGGTDQLFNMQVGRHLQESQNKSPQIIICMPLLRGLDGVKKMSKSLKNYIGLNDEPNDMFGKVMSLPDDLLPEYIRLTSDYENSKKEEILKMLGETNSNPMQIKKDLAKNIVEQYHSLGAAQKAVEYFENQFQNKSDEGKEYQEVNFEDLKITKDNDLIDLIIALKIRDSKSSARQLIIGGGISIDGQKNTDPKSKIPQKNFKLRSGKLNFFEIKF